MRVAPSLVLLFALASCAMPRVDPPSLAPRAAEAIDPRVPVVRAVEQRQADASVTGRLATLIVEARRGDDAFRAALAAAERAVAAAGSRESESWVVAQETVSAVVEARGPTSQALGDIDAIAAEMLQSKGDVSRGDLAAIQNAGAEVAAIDNRQAQALDALQRRLGG
jgi:hypothetical protein